MRVVDSDLIYPLCLPWPVKFLARLLVAGVVLCGMLLEVNDAAVALVNLLAWRSWRHLGRFERAYRDALLHCKRSGRMEIRAFDQSDYVALTWGPPSRFPGFVAVRFEGYDGKPLEILIFCRYDRRRSYRRVIVKLMYHQH